MKVWSVVSGQCSILESVVVGQILSYKRKDPLELGRSVTPLVLF